MRSATGVGKLSLQGHALMQPSAVTCHDLQQHLHDIVLSTYQSCSDFGFLTTIGVVLSVCIGSRLGMVSSTAITL